MTLDSLAYKISSFNRSRKWNTFLAETAPTAEMKVLDVGFSDLEYSSTDNFIEKNYPYPEMLTALGVDAPDEFLKRYPKIKVSTYDGSDFPFEDNAFDICWSNAVIEHVGKLDRQLHFLCEMKRVAKTVFFTTPNRYFPVEVHTRVPLLHILLPKCYFDGFLRMIGKEWATGDYMNLLSLSDIKGLLDKAGITDYKIIENKLLGFTLDYIIIL